MKIVTTAGVVIVMGALVGCGAPNAEPDPGAADGSGGSGRPSDSNASDTGHDDGGRAAADAKDEEAGAGSKPDGGDAQDRGDAQDGGATQDSDASVSDPCAGSAARLYQDTNYAGYEVCLSPGRYDASALQALGAKAQDISSLRVQPGYRVTLYASDAFSGARLVESRDTPSLFANAFNDLATSIVVAPTPIAQHGALHVCGSKLCDSSNAAVQLVGWGWGPVEWYGGANANQPTAAGVQNMIRQFYGSAMRVPTWNQSYSDNPSNTFAKMDPLIQEGIAEGIYVLVDWHNAEGDPLTRVDAAKAFFDTQAAKYAAYPNVIYEIFNEPNNVTWHDHIKPYAEQVIPVIRARAPNSVIVVGTESWSSQPGATVAEPLSYPNVMYTFHFYSKTSMNISDAQNAIDHGLALFFTEWGTTTYTGQGGHDYDSGQGWVDFMTNNQQSWTTFNFGTWDPVGADPPDDCSSFFIGADNNGPWTEDQITPDAKWKRDRTP